MRLKPFTLYIMYEQNSDESFDPAYILPLFKRRSAWVAIIETSDPRSKVFISTEHPENHHTYDEFEEAEEYDKIYDYTVEASEAQLKEFVENKKHLGEVFDKIFNEAPKYVVKK